MTKFGIVGSDDEVAHHRQLTTTTQCKSTDSSNDGLANVADLLPIAGDVVALVGIGKTVFGHGTDVCASRKSLFTTSQNHASNVAIGIKGFEGSAHFIHQLVIQRIELLGAIQGDDANAGLCGDGNEFVGHDGIEKKKNGERII